MISYKVSVSLSKHVDENGAEGTRSNNYQSVKAEHYTLDLVDASYTDTDLEKVIARAMQTLEMHYPTKETPVDSE
jgi:hypothetical protein